MYKGLSRSSIFEMNLKTLFIECLKAPYIHVENAGDYWLKKRGNILYIYLECSSGLIDWKNNLDFLPTVKKNQFSDVCCHIRLSQKLSESPVNPYKNMSSVWFAHRGFLRVWKSIENHIRYDICDKRYKKMIIVGYSHGAALAMLCHEYIWYHRPDLRCSIQGYGFGCPRVFWGIKTRKTAKRWERFLVIRNIDDIVTHVPPAWLGFSHVGTVLSIGEKGKYTPIDAHRPENILSELSRDLST